MGLNSLGLGFIFTAKDLASGPVRRLNRNLIATDGAVAKANRGMSGSASAQRRMALGTIAANASTMVLGASIGGLLLQLGPLAAGLVAVGGAFSLANDAAGFEQQLVALGKISGATSEQMVQMKDKIIDVGLSSKFGPDEIVEGMKNMAAMGLNAKEAIASIAPAASLATAGQISLDNASNAVIGTIKSFGLEVTDAAEVAEKLMKASDISALGAQDFETGLSKAAATAGVLGQSLTTTLASMGALRNLNIDASSSSTALREAMRRLATDKVALEFLEKYEIATETADGKTRDLMDVLYDLEEKTRGLGADEMNKINVGVFGARGMMTFGALSKLVFKTMEDGVEVTYRGAEAFRKMKAAIDGSKGYLNDFTKAMLDTYEGQKTLLGGAWKTLKILAGEGIAKALKPMVRFFVVMIQDIAKWIKDISPETKELAGKFLLIGGAVMTVLSGVMLLGGGFMLIFGLMGAAVYGFKKLVEYNIGGIGDVFRNTVKKTWLFMKALMQVVTDGFLSGETLAEIMEEENAGVLRTLGTFVQIGHRIKRFFEGIGAGMQTAFKQNAHVFEVFFDALKQIGAEFGITEKGLGGLTTASDVWAERGEYVGRVLGRIATGAVIAATMAIKLATAMIRAGKWVADNWNMITGAVKSAILVYGTIIALKWVYIGALAAFEIAQIAAVTAVWALTSAELRGRIVMLANYAVLVVVTTAQKALTAARVIATMVSSRAAAAEAIMTARTWAGAAAARAAAAAQGGLSGSIGGTAGKLLGKLGLVAAAGAAGYAFGQWLDETFQLSDGLADLLSDVLGLTDAMNNLSYVDKNGNIVKVGSEYGNSAADSVARGAPKFLGGGQPSATQGSTTVRAPDVVGGIPPTSTAGLDPAMVKDLADAEKELAMLMREQQANPTQVNLFMDSEKIAEAAVKGRRAASAREFGSDE